MKKRLKQAVILLMVVILVGTICPVTALAAPEVPGKVKMTEIFAYPSSVRLKWENAKNATSYRIYYRPSTTKKWKTLKTVNSKTTSYTHKKSRKNTLKAGKKYYYTVRAYNEYSKQWGKYDTKGKYIYIPVVPKTIKRSTVKVSSKKKVTIKWKKKKNATYYRVYYRPSNGKQWKAIKTVNNKTTRYTHRSSRKYPLKAGKKYYYTVQAFYDSPNKGEWKKGQKWEGTKIGEGEIEKGGNTWEYFTW